jgi:hypothetical protein
MGAFCISYSAFDARLHLSSGVAGALFSPGHDEASIEHTALRFVPVVGSNSWRNTRRDRSQRVRERRKFDLALRNRHARSGRPCINFAYHTLQATILCRDLVRPTILSPPSTTYESHRLPRDIHPRWFPNSLLNHIAIPRSIVDQMASIASPVPSPDRA